MKVTAKVIDSVLEIIYTTDITTFDGLLNKLKLSKTDLIIALAILANDRYIDIESIENVKVISSVSITVPGIKFYNEGGYVEAERLKRLNENQLTSVIKTNRLTWVSILSTIIFSVVVTAIQLLTYSRESRQELREERKIERDSIESAQQLKHDSLYENYLLRKAQEVSNVSKTDTSKYK
jgi:hypothetical protein